LPLFFFRIAFVKAPKLIHDPVKAACGIILIGHFFGADAFQFLPTLHATGQFGWAFGISRRESTIQRSAAEVKSKLSPRLAVQRRPRVARNCLRGFTAEMIAAGLMGRQSCSRVFRARCHGRSFRQRHAPSHHPGANSETDRQTQKTPWPKPGRFLVIVENFASISA
jgi:hypothetical protein